MEGPTKQIGGTSHLDQHYCELQYITLTRITEYIVARLVTIQILHFTRDKVQTPAVELFVSPLRFVCLCDCIDNKGLRVELNKTGGFHGGVHKKINFYALFGYADCQIITDV